MKNVMWIALMLSVALFAGSLFLGNTTTDEWDHKDRRSSIFGLR